MYILIGLGPNSVEVPCLWFSDEASAIHYVTEILGPPKTNKHGNYTWDVDEVTMNGQYDEDSDEPSGVSHKFFTHYYDGCGRCYRFVLENVPEGKPFVGFDLD